MTREYVDDRCCPQCKAETPHTCVDSEHERDSSGDMQTCQRCHWYRLGHGAPMPPIDLAD